MKDSPDPLYNRAYALHNIPLCSIRVTQVPRMVVMDPLAVRQAGSVEVWLVGAVLSGRVLVLVLSGRVLVLAL